MKRHRMVGTHRGLTLIQFMLMLVVVGIVAYWLVEYLRTRLV